ncbi:MAG: hypothetical protein ACI9XO_003242 [Paraglaciecola sp.]|jgi:hypothetical protein
MKLENNAAFFFDAHLHFDFFLVENLNGLINPIN